MNTKNNENSKQESEAYMGFDLSKDILKTILKMVSAEDWDWNVDEAKPIPGADGMVLVREGSKAFTDRRAQRGIFMIPLRMQGTIDGVKAEVIFFACTD